MAGLLETYEPGHKFDSPMARFVYERCLGNGDFGDDKESDGQGTWCARYGRRTLYGDSSGFVGLDTRSSVAAAEELFAVIREDFYARCEECGESVHNDEDSWYEHTASECVPWTSPDSDHRGCYTNGNGVAWRLVGVGCSPLTAGQVRAVMVGDDRVVVFDLDNLAPLADEDYCHECGQIGCTADGR